MRDNIKRALIIFTAAAALLLCGCGGSRDTVPAPIPVPSGGWTPAALITTVYIEGNKLSCPPEFGDFKKNVKFSSDTPEGRDNTLAVPVYSKNESVVCTLIFSGVSKFSDLTDSSPIREILLTDTVGIGDEQVSLNGIIMGDSRERVEELLGASDDQPTDSTYIYSLGKNKGEITIIFNREKVYNIFLSGLDK